MIRRSLFWTTMIGTALLAVLSLSGCDESAANAPVVVPAPKSQDATLSQVSAAVHQLRADNGRNPAGPARDAVELQGKIASAGLPNAAPADAQSAAETSALVFAGKITEATERATKAESALASLREQWKTDQEASKSQIEKLIGDYEAKLRAAHEEAERKAYLQVVWVFAVLGGAITLLGIGCAVTGWSRIGILCIPAGIIIGGSGLLWGKPWFLFTIGGGVLLCAVAAGIYWAVRIYEGQKPQTVLAAAADLPAEIKQAAVDLIARLKTDPAKTNSGTGVTPAG